MQIEDVADKVPHLVAFNIVSMGTLATFLSLILNWGGLCIDVLGYVIISTYTHWLPLYQPIVN